jgi:hypothetical protein
MGENQCFTSITSFEASADLECKAASNITPSQAPTHNPVFPIKNPAMMQGNYTVMPPNDRVIGQTH